MGVRVCACGRLLCAYLDSFREVSRYARTSGFEWGMMCVGVRFVCKSVLLDWGHG